MSILTFHDATELFLILICEYLGVNSKNQSFMDYWNIIKQSADIELTSKRFMKKLNDSRNNLKHNAHPESDLLIEEFRVNSRIFLKKMQKKFLTLIF